MSNNNGKVRKMEKLKVEKLYLRNVINIFILKEI